MERNVTHDSSLVQPHWLLGEGEGAGGEGGQGGNAGGDNPGGGTGGEGGGEGGGNPSIEAQIQAAVEQATQGLRQNRDQVLAEKRKLTEQFTALSNQLEALGGAEGIKRLTAMHDSLMKDELGKLLAEGKHDEWFERRTQALRGDYEQRVEALQKQLNEAAEGREAANTKLARTLLKTEVDAASVEAEVEKTALEDVRLAAEQVFTYDETIGKHVIQDENGVVLLGKDGQTPKTVLEWLEEQRQPRRHWFPPSQGAGANGAHGNNNGNPGVAPDASAVSKMSMSEYKQYRKTQGLGDQVRHGIPG